MEFDLIISNPPYGKIGANITKDIIDFVEYKEFINLLPANDYKRNETADLYNYQSDMEAINNGFAGDAYVTTHIAKIHKDKVNNMTLDEFERSQYIDRQLDKYFEGIYNSDYKAVIGEERGSDRGKSKWWSDKTIVIGWRDVTNKHMPYTKNVLSYKWNYLKELSYSDELKTGRDARIMFYGIHFRTPEEKQNFAEFMYSADGFRFLAKIFTALNQDGWISTDIWFPKVDWTYSWTVEEILADYGYTETEIKEVMEDLKNYKGMKD